MIQIILLVFGVIAAIRLPRLLRARPTDYPGVDEDAFRAWRSAELASAIWLIVASWGVLVVQLVGGVVVGVVLAATHRTQEQIGHASMIVTFAGLGLFVAMLVPTAIYGSKAQRLKKRAGIPWPKKSAS